LLCIAPALIGLLALVQTAEAYAPLVEKQVFSADNFTTAGGEAIARVEVGFETYGRLSEAKDNVVLITHHLGGTSHAAGRYTEDGARGYWDTIIGSGLAIDTDRFFVVAVDSLANANVNNPQVTSTGPSSIDPATGKPYGMRFPIVTIRDFVEVQRMVLDSLGIERLHAVIGSGMGGAQAYEWAAVYPDRIDRLVVSTVAGWIDAHMIAWFDAWAAPIMLDPNWNGGDYYDGEPPVRGLTVTMTLATLLAQHWQWTDEVFGRRWADPGKDPATSFDHRFEVEAVIEQISQASAAVADANHMLYSIKAYQLFYAGHGDGLLDGLRAIRAPTLVIHSDEDQMAPSELVRDTATIIRANGTAVRMVEIAGTRGHLNGLFSIDQAADAIGDFLSD